MTGKVKILVQVSRTDYEILKVLQEHCFMIADLKPVSDRKVLLEIEAFSYLTIEEAD